ncbi:MAG: hypothetical protein M1469_05230 [Bacteroidetes bacterium]|nr:hypothetical protein [Bacteroidota bacterium]
MKKVYAISVYAIAMAYVESAVVVYLREMIFGSVSEVFPLKYLQPNLALIEIGREAATIIMLLAVGALAGRNRFQKWMFFIYAFALWDIFYYVFLRLIIGWPGSFLSFDILFLIPIAWIGPVLSPVLVSLLLAVASLALILLSDRSDEVRIDRLNFWVFVAGCSVVFYSFTGGVFHILFSRGPKGIESYVPKTFDWFTFVVGYLIMCVATVSILSDAYRRTKTEKVIQ